MSADQSRAVEHLMALAYKHSQLYYDWHNDAVRYKTFEAARDELRAAITTALREQYIAGMERAAVICDEQAKEPECPERAEYCAFAIRAVAAEVKS